MPDLRFWLHGNEAAKTATAAAALTETLGSDDATTTPANRSPPPKLKTIDPLEGCELIVSVPSTIINTNNLVHRIRARPKAFLLPVRRSLSPVNLFRERMRAMHFSEAGNARHRCRYCTAMINR
jgi:hypothetical protein